MAGRHRRPSVHTNSTTLRAPAKEWIRDAWTVIVNTVNPAPAPHTVGADAHIPAPADTTGEDA